MSFVTKIGVITLLAPTIMFTDITFKLDKAEFCHLSRKGTSSK